MPGVYCPRCKSNVILEQDGVSCSNCGRQLVMPAGRDEEQPTQSTRPKPKGAK